MKSGERVATVSPRRPLVTAGFSFDDEPMVNSQDELTVVGHIMTPAQAGFWAPLAASRGPAGPRLFMCAEHVRQLGAESPLHNLMEVK
ncbi:MAG: hypothetical protein ABSA59_18415 [Terriglobia bacterium]